MSKQPEALRLADLLDLLQGPGRSLKCEAEAAAELRRQHAQIAELVTELSYLHLAARRVVQCDDKNELDQHHIDHLRLRVDQSSAAITKASQGSQA